MIVADLSRALAGPQAMMMMGDLGARIVKVEAVGHGDDTRGWGPPFVGPEDDRQSTYFLSANRNKESIALDLKADADREVLLQLVDRADVLVENFRTGVLERLGLGIDSLLERNPRLVVLSITGFGHDGPGPPLRFFDATGTETTHREHAAPPLLDEHGEDLRSWLDGGTA